MSATKYMSITIRTDRDVTKYSAHRACHLCARTLPEGAHAYVKDTMIATNLDNIRVQTYMCPPCKSYRRKAGIK